MGKETAARGNRSTPLFLLLLLLLRQKEDQKLPPLFFLIPVTIEEEEDGKENNKKRRERVSFLCVEWLMKEAVPLYSTAPAGSAATHSLLCVL